MNIGHDQIMQENGIASSSQQKKYSIHTEVRLKSVYNVNLPAIRESVKAFIQEPLQTDKNATINLGKEVSGWHNQEILEKFVDRINICESHSDQNLNSVRIDSAELIIHAYHAAHQDDMEELMANEGGNMGEDGSQDDTMAATILELPNASLEGSWETLYYDWGIKENLLSYIYTTLIYSDANVDSNIISWNRLLLLHGPPGTGKTSLCKALAHKLSIRLADRYAYGKLVEINSHSLFSKWFSESGKLVQRLFNLINEMISDPDAFIVILIDEVESLTAARSSASNGSEPSDAVRVVNALLTQLDKLKNRKNVLVITTSNISESIDNAFIDRADIKQYIGPPNAIAIYHVFRSCVQELMRVKLIGYEHIDEHQIENDLRKLAGLAVGLSGRTLRRLPVLAHSKHFLEFKSVPFDKWIDAMEHVIAHSHLEVNDVKSGSRKHNGTVGTLLS